MERPRVVLLGASNLTLGLPYALAIARAVAGGPVEALVAAGHGRSYGRWSRVLARGLPGILQSELWAEAGRAAGGPAYALVTDVGNDLAYGVSPAEVAGWVRETLARLAPLGARVVVTRLPEESLAALGPVRFRVAASLLFPGRRLSRAGIREATADLNRRLAEVAAGHGAELVAPEAAWYGPDAIHFRRRARPLAWSGILAPWSPAPPPSEARRSGRPARIGRLAPARSKFLGVERRRSQPALVLPDGSTVAGY